MPRLNLTHLTRFSTIDPALSRCTFHQVIVKVAETRPALQLTNTRAVPASVFEPISHVQVASPLALAAVAPRPFSVLTRPLGRVTASVQESFGLLECTVIDS